ncbi:hypothetical protein FRC02_006801 [Tulasnella sp. 418]|nr:hypothetical protein FRC02_006801 [Tulasnella sp. 418]
MGSIPIEPASPASSFDGVFDDESPCPDYLGEYLTSIRRAADIVRDIQSAFPDTSLVCSDLIRVLNELAMRVRQNHANDTWLEEAPPASILQTLRRLKNWAGPRQSLSELESPTKRDISISRLRSFTSKFQSILNGMDEAYVMPALTEYL